MDGVKSVYNVCIICTMAGMSGICEIFLCTLWPLMGKQEGLEKRRLKLIP